jgi:NAD(P)-dependent dehydrogenase (short-subunit alcohol dehydrogenase family)
MMLPPNNRIVMLSGATRGIGRAIAAQLYADGYRLSLGVRDPARVDAQLRADPGRVLVTPYDANDPVAAAEAWVAATVDHFGGIDAVVNDAAIVRRAAFEAVGEDDFDAIFRINVKAPFMVSQRAFPHLKACGHGRIVNIVSLGGLRLRNEQSMLYGMTKHAARAMTDGLRLNGWSHGIRATAICPGAVDTDMMKGTGVNPDDVSQPDDIAAIVAHALTLPNKASVAFVPINAVKENLY